MLRILPLLVLSAGPALAQERGPLGLATAPITGEANRIRYGRDSLQFGELRLPATDAPHPVAILVHGGCWVAQLGPLDPRAVAFDNLRPLAAALADAGIATWNVEYRRLGHDGAGWPGTFQDVGNAADFLRTLAAEHRLDLRRVITLGHSAGGHLALWLAARHRIPPASELFALDPLRVVGAVNLDGPQDLRTAHAVEQRVCGSPVITDLMGGSPEERPDRYHHTSPVLLQPLGVRQVVFAGRMFAEDARSYVALARRAGDPVDAVVDDAGGHFGFIDPESEWWPQVLDRVRHLLSPADRPGPAPAGQASAPGRPPATEPRSTPMIMTVLEARVAPEQWEALRRAYDARARLPPSGEIVESFLVQSDGDGTTLRIITIWRDREALEAMRASGETPAGVLIFCDAGAEPALTVFSVWANPRGGGAPH
jgi:acetyl esterase/lipase